MRHRINIEELSWMDLSIDNVVFASHGKGENKRITAVWNVLTDRRFFIVLNHGETVGEYSNLIDAVKAYNEV